MYFPFLSSGKFISLKTLQGWRLGTRENDIVLKLSRVYHAPPYGTYVTRTQKVTKLNKVLHKKILPFIDQEIDF